jgi:hypothetical protein
MTTVEAFDPGIINYGTYLWAMTNERTGFVRYIWAPPTKCII